MSEKEEFWSDLDRVVGKVPTGEKLVLCGDMNGHVGAETDGLEGVHGGSGFGIRNTEGEMLLEFAVSLELVVGNTCFKKEDAKKITYELGGCKTVLDYVLVKGCDRGMLQDVTVISGEPCLTQHKLVICRLTLKETVKRKKKTFVSRCALWRLKDPDLKARFVEKVRAKADLRTHKHLEEEWKDLKDCLLDTANEVCGKTSGPPRYTVKW